MPVQLIQDAAAQDHAEVSMAAQQVQSCEDKALDTAIPIGIVACCVKGKRSVPYVLPESRIRQKALS